MKTHGKGSTYRSGCRCTKCEIGFRRQLKRTRRRQKLGIKVLTPADSTRLIINELMDVRHWTLEEIAAAVYLSTCTVSYIRCGQQSLIRRDNHLQFVRLAMTAEFRRKHQGSYIQSPLLVPALRGLYAQGYTAEWLGEQLGRSSRWAGQIMRSTAKRHFVSPTLESRLMALVKEIGSTDGGDARAKNVAMRQGWKPTMYVDDLV